MPRFAANLSMMFTEVPFLERFARAKAAGFEAVEFLFPYDWEPDTLAGLLRDNGLQQVLFNMPPGDWDAGDRGMACLPGREAEFRDGVERAIGYAQALACPRIHAMAGLVPEDADPAELRATYEANVSAAAERCAEAGLALLIEPINPHDMPGFFLNRFDLALEVIAAIEARGGVAPALQFDIYHCARIHGQVADWIVRCAPRIAHYQIAGTPDRHEPDKGDLPLTEVLAAVDAHTPDLWIGCEYRPEGQTEAGLGWLEAVS